MKASSSAQRRVRIRRRLLLAGWLVAAGTILVRSAQLQVLEAEDWRVTAVGQQRKTVDVPASRGAVRAR